MAKYTALPTSDANLSVTLTEDDDLVVLNVNPANVTATGTGNIDSVNGQTGVVVLDTDDVAEGTTNLYYTDARADARAQLKIDALIDGAPGALDTLNEIAAAINDDADVYNTLNGLITTNSTNIALKANSADLADVATSGDYNDLTNTPTIPTNNNQLANGAGYITDYTVTESDVTAHQAALSITESQISDLDHYTDTDVDAHLSGGTGVTYTAGEIAIGQSVGTTDDVTFNSVTAEMYGASHLNVKNDEGAQITKGTPVYFKGISGNKITVGVADANTPAKMPAFGIASADANDQANVDIVVAGELTEMDTSTYSVNDELYVSTTGTLTTTRPSGADDAIQKIARVAKVHASSGILYVMGAGRSNDIPNLATGEVFIGNGSGYEKRALTEADISDLQSYLTAETNDLSSAVVWANVPDANITQSSVTQHQSALSITESQISDLSHFSGAYADLTGKPTIPTNNNQLTNGAGYITDYTVTESDVTAHQAALSITESQISDLSHFSGDYNDLTNKPTIPSAYGDSDVDTHLNTSTATADQHLAWSGTDYEWVDAAAGIDNVVEDTTPQLGGDLDVNGNSIVSVSNGNINITPNGTGKVVLDGLNYPTSDGTDGQVLTTDGNGNLAFEDASGGGLTASTTPTLSGDSTAFSSLDYTLTISNHSSYDLPTYRVELIQDSGSVQKVDPDDVTDNGDGTLTFTMPSTTGAHTIKVKAQDFGNGASAEATKAVTLSNLSFSNRYYRMKNFSHASNTSIMFTEVRLYDAVAQGGTKYPTNMTANNAPSPYVASAQGTYGTYDPYKAFDGLTYTQWWNLATTTYSTDYLAIDLGSSAPTIKSFKFRAGNSASYLGSFDLYRADSSDFSDEVKIATLEFTAANQEITLG